MARFDYRKLSDMQRQELVGELLDIMATVKDKKDLQTFFLQLVTPSEAVMLARRWQIAQRLAGGKSYYRIAEELKVGISTIESVDRWLSEAIGDYRERVAEAKLKDARRKNRPTPFRIFPNTLPFLLFNLLVAGGARMWWTAALTPKGKSKKEKKVKK